MMDNRQKEIKKTLAERDKILKKVARIRQQFWMAEKALEELR
jgi:hypothetical protein